MERIGMSRDLANNFEHPNLPEGPQQRPHAVYRLSRSVWAKSHSHRAQIKRSFTGGLDVAVHAQQLIVPI